MIAPSPSPSPLPPAPPAIHRPYKPIGAALDVVRSRDPEVMFSGPAGTGKSRCVLEKLYAVAEKYAGARILIIRKTRASCTDSVLVTWEEKVVPAGHACIGKVGRENRHSYKFPNGSEIVVGGMDRPTRIMSTEWDIVYVPEAIEMTEAEWETLSSRLRNGVVPYQQMIGDTNPDGPQHWIIQRSHRGVLRLIESRHEDNPTLYDRAKAVWTSFGKKYIAVLDRLTGVRFKRLRHGLWVAAEGLVWEGFDPNVHQISASSLPVGWQLWPRYWGVDFGFTNPFVWQEWCKAPDGELYRIREIYRSKRLVEDHASDILALIGRKMTFDSEGKPTGRLVATREDPDPLPVAIICDHDAEDRATFERHTGMKTIGAYKAVQSGIQGVAARLKLVPEGHPKAKPRLYLVRDALVHRDEERTERRLPCSTEEEIVEYIWDTANGRKTGEEPVKSNDHGCDTARYVVAHVDELSKTGKRNRFRPLEI